MLRQAVSKLVYLRSKLDHEQNIKRHQSHLTVSFNFQKKFLDIGNPGLMPVHRESGSWLQLMLLSVIDP